MILTSDPNGNTAGAEWLVDAYECDADALRSPDAIGRVFDELVNALRLHPVCAPSWHIFPGEGGLTGYLVLRESHVSCHTFPERGFAAFNLYCCQPRDDWAWAEHLGSLLRAGKVVIRRVERGVFGPLDATAGEVDARRKSRLDASA